MMNGAESIGSIMLLLAGLLLPGVILAKAMRWPLPWLIGGMLSALGLFSGVIALNACNVRVTVLTLGGWQTCLALGGIIFSQRHRTSTPPVSRSFSQLWIAAPALPMVAVGIWRAVTQPLPGADVDFRWNYLAEIIVNTGGLAHYPAFTAEDFAQYFWPDGIAPLVSSVYAWTYLAAGSTAKIGTAWPVLLQLAGILTLLFALGRLWGGTRGGWFACALGGGTMLLQFALNLGQETGLTTLGVGGLAFYQTLWERTRRTDLLIPAAACASLTACAREYGLIIPVVGAVWLLVARAGWQKVAWYLMGALALPMVWHLRNWLRTGNPFYAQDVAGIFPVNPVFAVWMRGYVDIYGATLWQWTGWMETFRLLILTALPACLGLLAGASCWRRQPGWAGLLGLAGAIALCWLISVPYTAGGLFYSMRVLGPLLLLGCAWGGACLARWVPGQRYLAGVMLGLSLYSLDASLRAWTMPMNPYTIDPGKWSRAGYQFQQDFARDDQEFLNSLVRLVPGKVLSDSAGVQQIFHAQGKKLVPFWSPEVRFLFAADDHGDVVTRLRELGYTHLLLKRAQFSVDFLVRTGVLPRLGKRVHLTMSNQSYVMFSLDEETSPGHTSAP